MDKGKDNKDHGKKDVDPKKKVVMYNEDLYYNTNRIRMRNGTYAVKSTTQVPNLFCQYHNYPHPCILCDKNIPHGPAKVDKYTFSSYNPPIAHCN